MKNIAVWALSVAAALAISSCSEPVDISDIAILTVSPSPIQIGASDQIVSRTFTVEATEDWNVAETSTWITSKNVTETGFTIEVAPYLDGADPSREGKIVVEMGERSQQITVTQLVYMIPYVLTVSPEAVTNALAEQQYNITVTASHAWQADPDKDWLHVTDVTETGFRISVDAYGDAAGDVRSGKVVVSSRDTECEVAVTQYKPLPDATPLSAYLGEYDIVGESGTGATKSPYRADATMVLRTDIGDNVISIDILGGGVDPLCFLYNPVTGEIENYNHEVRTDLHRGTTFSFYTDVIINWTQTTAFFPIPAGEFSMTFNEDNEIVFPTAAELDLDTAGIYPGYTLEEGTKPVYVLMLYYVSGISQSTAITNVKMVKKN